jgi:hypothetical protein
MKPNSEFLNLPSSFWANVRLIGQQAGYTDKATKQIKIPTTDEMKEELNRLEIHLDKGFQDILGSYFKYRATVLNTYVQERLMDVERARELFESYRDRLKPTCSIPLNKQSGEKKAPAYFTGLINMMIEANARGLNCDYDPRRLPTFTKGDFLVRTLARRVDGAFPTSVNPIALWEIKEYYYTTTFGSRIADAIYETMLDGHELEELWMQEGIKVKHYLMVDARETWWEMGKSYLCRIIDILHMGYVDEVLFGYEVIERLPDIVKEWVAILKKPQV